MADLHEALTYLKPVSWSDVPASSASTNDLHEYTQAILSKARLVVESVPEQNPSSGTPSTTSAASTTQIDSLRKEWGKPLKMNNAKENPLNIPVYKLSGKDGKGAWFARRSVHKGLPFSRWKAKMQAEMGESLRARQEEIKQGRMPEMCVRGIGADRRLEKIYISRTGHHEDRDGNSDSDKALARLEVYQQSAQFPGPTTARDFVTMIITTDELLSDGADSGPPLPPTYMIVSKPCQHPDAPVRNDYIRGQYESVEVIRELPTEESTASSNTKNGDSDTTQAGNGKAETENSATTSTVEDDPNPVEWIMITRSDPGGSVPKWMVERGTPKSITGDAVKFLNWASKPDEGNGTAGIDEMTESAENKSSVSNVDGVGQVLSSEGTVVSDQQPDAVNTNGKGVEQLDRPMEETDYVDNDGTQQEDANIWSNVAKMVQDYTPRAVFNYMPGRLSPSLGWESKDEEDEDEEESRKTTIPMKEAKSGPGEGEADEGPAGITKATGTDETNDTSSLVSDDESFTSAESHPPASPVTSGSTPQVYIHRPHNDNASQTTSALNSEAALGTAAIANSTKKPSSKEKELAKLNARKREVEINLASVRSEIRELGGPASKGGNADLLRTDVDSVHSSTISGESSSNAKKEETKSMSSSNDPATPSTSSSTAVPSTAQTAILAVQNNQNQKRIDHLLRSESKLIARLNKIEAQQLKVSKKLEAHQRKAVGKEEKAKSRSELESLRREITSLRNELRDLRGEREKWVDIVGRLQKENTRLVDQARKHGIKEGYETD